MNIEQQFGRSQVKIESVASVVKNVYINSSPKGLENEFKTLLTPDAIEFLVNLTLQFETKINNLYNTRLGRKYKFKSNQRIPNFVRSTIPIEERDWNVAPVAKRLRNRRLDLGDVSPSNINHFSAALRAEVQGVQVDFDDGHCPTWKNQIFGLYNVYRAVRCELPNVPPLSEAPILMLRPRAWNIIEHNMSINGRKIPGPLFDFGLLIFHNGYILSKCEVGPYFYLSKLEGANEARLWNEIFTWTQLTLGIPHGTIKACVLIENILSSFEMESILYELKDHSLGLNCGIWDYTASIINKFGENKLFLLPDRNKYVNINKRFLRRYMELVIQICHKRGASATGGMAADILPLEENSKEYVLVIEKVKKTKLLEIEMNIDGFLVYDVKLVPHLNILWKEHDKLLLNQVKCHRLSEVSEVDLLTLPKGGVTRDGLQHNISIALLFIYNWLNGKGHFIYEGLVEDSATAEISRAQVWQWIRHCVNLENENTVVTRELVHTYASDILKNLQKQTTCIEEKKRMSIAFNLFVELVNCRELPEFITTYLNDAHIFRNIHASL